MRTNTISTHREPSPQLLHSNLKTSSARMNERHKQTKTKKKKQNCYFARRAQKASITHSRCTCRTANKTYINIKLKMREKRIEIRVMCDVYAFYAFHRGLAWVSCRANHFNNGVDAFSVATVVIMQENHFPGSIATRWAWDVTQFAANNFCVAFCCESPTRNKFAASEFSYSFRLNNFANSISMRKMHRDSWALRCRIATDAIEIENANTFQLFCLMLNFN